jgi:two-component system, OmpR family, sensor histidine kinase KdpD
MAEEYSRPDPDALLARVKVEEEKAKRGKLKIFLGYIPGVGKTYTMLEAAHQQQKDVDVVVGYVDTHGRVDTEALLKGLEIVPRKTVDYRGIVLTEMDLDAVLARHPRLALVDELAHENAPGSRHVKRYQDIEELLHAGIDVYTTLNIQHLESSRNVVSEITGIWMRETVPDSIIDSAAEIELVDLPPDDLIKRLRQGKVYIPEQISLAREQFFRKGNLTALRELTMRVAAKHVDEQTLEYMKAHGIPGPWPSGERILLLLGPGSYGSSLVRNARRLAHELGSEWYAVYVETPNAVRFSADQQNLIADSLQLAQRLGAQAVTIQGESVERAILEYARTHHITRIVIAKPQVKRWQKSIKESTVDHIIGESQNIDVFLIGSGGEAVKQTRKFSWQVFGTNWLGYIQGLGLIVLATLLGKFVPGIFVPANLIMLYLLCVVATAFFWGFGPSILVSIVSVLVFDFLFISPFFTFSVVDTKYFLTFIVLLLVGLIISYLMRKIRQQTEGAVLRQRQTTALYALGRDLAISSSLEAYVSAIVVRLRETFRREAILYLPVPHNNAMLEAHSDHPDVKVDESEKAAAIWSYQHQKMVGRGTDTLPNAAARYLPMFTSRGTIGVLALQISDSGSNDLTLDQERLLEAYVDLAAVAIEGIQLGEEVHNAQVLSRVMRDTEKLQTALLNSISHDLRTPLVSVIGTLSSLQEEGVRLDESARNNLIQVAREEAERLNRLISNLLDVSRIEAGALKINRQPSEVQDLVGTALEQLGERTRVRPIKIDIPEFLPYISVDFTLIVQALVNILDNALKYSPNGSPVEIKGQQNDKEITLTVADRGIGIPPQDLEHIFDKFFRVHRPDKIQGTGLGLSISRGIIEAHGGHIQAENRPLGGTIIRISLPIAESSPGKERNGNER